MAPLTRAQIANRDRIESLIGLAAPFLDLVLAAGDRISRIAEPADDDYYPIRSGGRVPLPGRARLRGRRRPAGPVRLPRPWCLTPARRRAGLHA